jgi:hypothetical protein
MVNLAIESPALHSVIAKVFAPRALWNIRPTEQFQKLLSCNRSQVVHFFAGTAATLATALDLDFPFALPWLRAVDISIFPALDGLML